MKQEFLSKSEFTPVSGWLHGVFFASGAAALIYQLVWARMLELVFGITVFAVSTVLTAFMAGIALGSLCFGKIADRIRRPIFLLVIFEGGLALFALAFPELLRLTLNIASLAPSDGTIPLFAHSLIRFALSFFLLLFPSAMIGGGLPVIGKILIRGSNRLGARIGGLYAAYNAGAFLGCLLTGFFLIRLLGMTGAVHVGVALNGVNFLVLVFLIPKFHDPPPLHEEENIRQKMSSHIPFRVRIILAALVLEGFCAAAYEVAWMRALIPFSSDKSLALTSTVFAAFLFGLAAGSLVVKRWIDRRRDLILILGIIESAVGLAGLATLTVLLRAGTRFMALRPGYPESWWTTIGREYGVFFLILAVPATLMGMTFPIFARLLCDSIRRLGGRLGRLGFLDTAGSILGGFAAGFFLIPSVGTFRTGVIAAFLSLAVGIVLLLIDTERRRRTRLLFVAGGLLLSAGLSAFLPSAGDWNTWQGRRSEDLPIFQAEGPSATVSVFENLEGERRLAINGSLSAFGEGDLIIDKMRGLVPAFLHPNPKTALAVGLGMGVAARSLLVPGVKRLDCIELSETVADASDSCYSGVNDRVAHNPRFHLVIEDGRNFLMTTDSTYDVISSNSIHARLSGFLYTREFYEICKNRLNPNGVMCQWLTTNWMTEGEFKRLVSAFLTEFLHAQLWASGVSNLILVGSQNPLRVDIALWDRMLGHPEMKPLLTDSLLLDPLDDLPRLLAHFVCTEASLKEYVRDTAPETDDRTKTEFSRVVKPLCNPRIIESLVRMKTDLTPWVVFSGDDSKMEEVRRRIVTCAEAEKNCMTGDLAFNYLGDRETGIGLLRDAVRKDSLSFRYRDCLSSYYRLDGKFTEAIETLLPLVPVRQNQTRLFRYLGMLQLENGELIQAIQTLDPAVSRGDLLSQYFLGLAYTQMRQPAQALTWMTRVAERRPGFSDARFQLGIISLMLGKSGDAYEYLQSCLDQDYKTSEIRQIAKEFPKLGIE